MNKLVSFLLFSLALTTGCAGSDDLTKHEVCSRISEAACGRAAVCEPTVNQDGCFAKAMARCCPDGVCDEVVVADEPRLAACESAVKTMSCSDLDDGDMPSACEHLDDEKPMDMPQDDPPPSDEDPATQPGVLEVNWSIYAGGTSLSCSQFLNATTLRISATDPDGMTITRDFACADGSALTHLPLGPFSIRASLRTGNGQVIQETTASTVVVSLGGTSTSFTFQVTTRFGTYCTQMADKICSTCAPSDTTCRMEIYNGCCGDSGSCNRPAVVEPTPWNQCLAGYGSGQYCDGTSSPPICSGVIDVY